MLFKIFYIKLTTKLGRTKHFALPLTVHLTFKAPQTLTV